MSNRIEIKAPMSGVFYRNPSPEEPPYVEIGTAVKKKQVMGLLETMKVFQKIKCPVDGKVAEILVENEAFLKDGAIIFIIETE